MEKAAVRLNLSKARNGASVGELQVQFDGLSLSPSLSNGVEG